MKNINFKREKKTIFLSCIIYSLLCQVASIVIIGFDEGFLLGTFVGAVCALANFILLECVVDIATIRKQILLAFLLHLGRLFIYGFAAFMCFKFSQRAVIAYGISVLGIVVGAVITYTERGRK